jgi:hypothetical protein
MKALTSLNLQEIRNAGIVIPDGTSLYRPGGYPRIGLAPLSASLSTRSSALLEKQLLKAEHGRGNTLFTTTGLRRLDPRLANELVSVYLGLAEKFRGVWVEHVGFCSDISDQGVATGATTESFARSYPRLYSIAQDLGEADVREVMAAVYRGDYERNTTARAIREFTKAPWSIYKRDALSHGYIEISENYSHPQVQASLHAYGDARNISRARHGKPASWPAMQTSRLSATFVHEYGHAVENALLDLGDEAWKYVINALEDCILRNPNGNGKWRISDRKLHAAGLLRSDARLVNYPRVFDKANNAGNGEWRRLVRKVVGLEMSQEIGVYAADWLDECFAEAFMMSIVSAKPAIKKQLAPFQEALYDVGLSVKRRRNI